MFSVLIAVYTIGILYVFCNNVGDFVRIGYTNSSIPDDFLGTVEYGFDDLCGSIFGALVYSCLWPIVKPCEYIKSQIDKVFPSFVEILEETTN